MASIPPRSTGIFRSKDELVNALADRIVDTGTQPVTSNGDANPRGEFRSVFYRAPPALLVHPAMTAIVVRRPRGVEHLGDHEHAGRAAPLGRLLTTVAQPDGGISGSTFNTCGRLSRAAGAWRRL